MAIDVQDLINQAFEGALPPEFFYNRISHKSTLKCSKEVLYFQSFKDDEGFIIFKGVIEVTGKFENFPKVKSALQALGALEA